MPTYANITPTPKVDGIVYASAVPLTSTEADLYNGTALDGQDPIQVAYGQCIQAVVQLTVSGAPQQNNTYVVMQTDLGDGVWIDVAWCVYVNNQAPGLFVFSAGNPSNNALSQTRQAGSTPTPQTATVNAMILGGRVRFVGKTTLAGGSSYVQGAFAGVRATITYKLSAPR